MTSLQTKPIALELRQVCKTYSPAVTVGPISFEVSEGEFFSLLGPSGCGKSTTLRCIAGFEEISTGEIHLSGERLDVIPAYRRKLGLVFQSHALFPHLNVEDNIAFGLHLRKTPAPEVRKRLAWGLELVGLTGLERRYPTQISGGQQQRVALARSLVLRPPLLLLDEPLSSLDLKLRQAMREELRRLTRQIGQTTVFVTHDQTEALSLSDRIAVLSDGRIEQIGTPHDIYRKPQTRFVASFIGQANLIEAVIAGSSGDIIDLSTPAGFRFVAARPDRGDWAIGRQVLAVVRPEDVILAAGHSADTIQNVFHGAIKDVVFLGEDTQVSLEINGLGRLTSSLKTTRDSSRNAAGSVVQLEVNPADVYLIAR